MWQPPLFSIKFHFYTCICKNCRGMFIRLNLMVCSGDEIAPAKLFRSFEMQKNKSELNGDSVQIFDCKHSNPPFSVPGKKNNRLFIFCFTSFKTWRRSTLKFVPPSTQNSQKNVSTFNITAGKFLAWSSSFSLSFSKFPSLCLSRALRVSIYLSLSFFLSCWCFISVFTVNWQL